MLFATALFGLALMQIKNRTRSLLSDIIGIQETVLVFWRGIIRFLPVGLFFMTAGHVLSANTDCLGDTSWFLATILTANVIYVFLVLPPIYCKDHFET